jgi:catecholate siderophore receptor
MDDQNITRLVEALRYVPGVSLESGEGNRDQVFIRGQGSSADFYLDGLRDDAPYYRPLYNVERIEVLKGANALIFGRGAGGGAINRVSKKADLMSGFVQAYASADSFGGFTLAADVNQPLASEFAGRLNATYEEFANHRDFYEGRFFGISPTLTASLGTGTRLTTTYRMTMMSGSPIAASRPAAACPSQATTEPCSVTLTSTPTSPACISPAAGSTTNCPTRSR